MNVHVVSVDIGGVVKAPFMAPKAQRACPEGHLVTRTIIGGSGVSVLKGLQDMDHCPGIAVRG
jgi:hypothetical protein